MNLRFKGKTVKDTKDMGLKIYLESLNIDISTFKKALVGNPEENTLFQDNTGVYVYVGDPDTFGRDFQYSNEIFELGGKVNTTENVIDVEFMALNGTLIYNTNSSGYYWDEDTLALTYHGFIIAYS